MEIIRQKGLGRGVAALECMKSRYETEQGVEALNEPNRRKMLLWDGVGERGWH